MTLRISHRLGILVTMSIGVCIFVSFMAWTKIRSEVSFAKSLSQQRLEPVWILEELSRVYSHEISDTAHQLRAQMIFWGEGEKTILKADQHIREALGKIQQSVLWLLKKKSCFWKLLRLLSNRFRPLRNSNQKYSLNLLTSLASL